MQKVQEVSTRVGFRKEIFGRKVFNVLFHQKDLFD